MKVGKKGKAAPHAAYIVREGQYAKRLERGEKLEATEAGNMPAWAKAQPQQFWRAADVFERVNGTTYREMEIALPRELEPAQRAELVREFVCQEIGEHHAYQWAIHTPNAADGGDQPHVHLMFSERQCDGIERDPDQYFKRYNAKAPEKGGARKGYGPSAGKTLTAAERAAELKALRERWQVLCNEHLEIAGHGQRIDMRSYAERGIKLAPERKQLPSEWRGQGKAKVIELRAARRDAFKAHRELANVVPNVKAEIISLEAERQKREQAVEQQAKAVLAQKQAQRTQRTEAEKAAVEAKRTVQALAPASTPVYPSVARLDPAEAEIQRLSRMTSAELAEEIRRRQLPSVDSLVEQDRMVMESTAKCRELHKQQEAAKAFVRKAEQAVDVWREQHPLKVKMHDAGVFRSAELLQLEQQAEQGQQTLKTLQAHSQAVSEKDQQLRRQARSRVIVAQSDHREELETLEQLRQNKARQELAAAAANRELEAVPKHFRSMAASREAKAFEWSDRGGKWLAAPEALKQLIDSYNASPKEVRVAVLARLITDKARSQQLRKLLDTQKANYRENDKGMSR
ncbi:MobA/MobL family protein [Comamonas sp. C11]|uniref:MobA/MobL family protein n=1 Tax=Comamonas sp. C11 TaxID=2966554 RepID=UPI0021134FD0|nr:MobA/MobL family protein [Comamonas sp. C11]UUC96750.1 MobA/MobL family protein [Comamonas sp. C11]